MDKWDAFLKMWQNICWTIGAEEYGLIPNYAKRFNR